MKNSCPVCGKLLQKCLIQNSYALVMCTDTECIYPFNQKSLEDNIVSVEEAEILGVAKLKMLKEEIALDVVKAITTYSENSVK